MNHKGPTIQEAGMLVLAPHVPARCRRRFWFAVKARGWSGADGSCTSRLLLVDFMPERDDIQGMIAEIFFITWFSAIESYGQLAPAGPL